MSRSNVQVPYVLKNVATIYDNSGQLSDMAFNSIEVSDEIDFKYSDDNKFVIEKMSGAPQGIRGVAMFQKTQIGLPGEVNVDIAHFKEDEIRLYSKLKLGFDGLVDYTFPTTRGNSGESLVSDDNGLLSWKASNSLLAAGFHQDGTQSIPSSVSNGTVALFNTTDYNTDVTKISISAGSVTVQDAGVYRISYEVRFNEEVLPVVNITGDRRVVFIAVNNLTGSNNRRYGRQFRNKTSNGTTEVCGTACIQLNAGDFINIRVFHDNSSGVSPTLQPLNISLDDPYGFGELNIEKIA